MTHKYKHYLSPFFVFIFLFICFLSCKEPDKSAVPVSLKRMLSEDTVYSRARDSLFTNPFWAREYIAGELERETDSVRWYAMLSLYNKVYLVTSRVDSVQLICDRIIEYCHRNENNSPYVNDLLADTYFTLGNTEIKNGNNDQALYYFKKTLAIYESRKDYLSLLNIQINVADSYLRLGKLPESIEYYRKAHQLADSIAASSEFIFIINSGLSEIYKQLGDYQTSIQYSDRAMTYLTGMHVPDRWLFYNNRGNLYYLQKEYPEALEWFLKAAGEVEDYPEFEYQLHFCGINLAEVYFLNGHSDSARYYLQRSVPYFEALGDQSILYHAATIQLGIALKEKRLAQAQLILARSPEESLVQPAILTLRQEYLQQYYEQVRDYKAANQIMKERIELSDSVNSHTIKMRVAEIEMRHRQDTTLLRQAGFIREQQNDLRTLKQRTLIGILLSAMLLLSILFRLFISKKKRQYEKMRQTHRVLELRMQSIRNRISPHFLFNTLNRLLHTCREDEGKARQITLITQLMRHNLLLTDKLCISLKEELEFIRNYLTLEQLTLPELNVNIRMDGEINPVQMIIPSMLIQIPVENAVKHGLRGWEGPKYLTISVNKQTNYYHISIEDNGTGFMASTGTDTPYSTGTGMKVITQTLQILNHYNNNPIEMRVTANQSTDNGRPGCRVNYIIPVDYNFRLER